MTDIAVGDTDGMDAVRVHLRASDAITDAELQQAWDVAAEACSPYIRDGYDIDAPPGVIEFVVNVAAHIWRTRDGGGDIQALPDGTWSSNSSVTRNLVKRYLPLGGRNVRTPRTVA